MTDLVSKCDYDTKLAVVQWAMKHIVDHAREGGSYRYLIYDRLGFGMDAYGALLDDGMTISNEFDLGLMDNVQELFKTVLNDEEGDYDLIKFKVEKMKEKFAICDEPGCSNRVCSGWPSENGYRRTCFEHSERKK